MAADKDLAVAWGEFVRTGLIRTWPQDEAFICYRAFCAGFEAASRKLVPVDESEDVW